jgi:hypothetical protein
MSWGKIRRQNPHPACMRAGLGITRTSNDCPRSACSAMMAAEALSKQTIASLFFTMQRTLRIKHTGFNAVARDLAKSV